jgi:hypothetical protein
MEVFPKFIIETDDELGDCLILSKVTYHKQIATDIDKVKGGGLFSLEHDTNTIVLSGESYDFGACKLEDLAKCVQNGNVYTNPTCTHSISEINDFIYMNECGERTNLKTYKL